MSKLCCFNIPDTPSIAVSLSCPSSCCESRLQRSQTDVPDLSSNKVMKTERDEKDKDDKTVCCCCFARKRHAKVMKSKREFEHGGGT